MNLRRKSDRHGTEKLFKVERRGGKGRLTTRRSADRTRWHFQALLFVGGKNSWEMGRQSRREGKGEGPK